MTKLLTTRKFLTTILLSTALLLTSWSASAYIQFSTSKPLPSNYDHFDFSYSVKYYIQDGGYRNAQSADWVEVNALPIFTKITNDSLLAMSQVAGSITSFGDNFVNLSFMTANTMS